MKSVKFIVIVSLMFLIVYGIADSSSVTLYIAALKGETVEGEWREYLEDYAKKNNIPAINPRIDKVWHLIPGYNGYVIDIEKTLELIKKDKPESKDEITLIWREIEPDNKIDEMGPHPIYRGNPEKPAVSFMINVAWGTEYLDSILKTLKKEQVKATFFLDGSWLTKNQEMVKRIVSEGHEIGNHAYSHPQMSRLTDDKIEQEIIKTEQLIYQTTNQPSTYFAPPSGDYNQRVVKKAYDIGLKTVLWTLDTVDWKKPPKEVIINRIISKVENGYLILLHPTEPTAEALPALIKEIKKKGLIITPVKETLSTKRILQVEQSNKF